MSGQTNVPPSAQPAPAKAARRRRRWPWILLGVFVLILLLIALLPTILSTGPVRRMVLGRVNQQLNGRAEIDSWSFGWFSGFKLSGIRLADAQGNSVVEVQSVTLPATVPALLNSRKQLGTITIESPKASIVLYADGTNNLTRLLKPSPDATSPASAGPQPLGFDVAGDIAVTNGAVSVQPAGAAEPFLVRDLNVDVKIASLEKPILLDVKAALGAGRAPLAVTGSATVLRAGKADPSVVEADIAVTLSGLEIGPVAALVRQYGSPVEAGGLLTVQKLSVQVHGMDSVKAAGDVEIKQLALSGGPLGGDRPKFDHVGLVFDVSKTGSTLEIKQFKFDSPVAAADANGSVQMPAPGKLPKGHLAADAQVNLAPLAAQLPETLRLQKGLTIESGTVKLDAKLDSDEKGPRVDASLRVEDVAAINEGKRITLEEPIALGLNASMTDKGPRLDDLRLTSSFATVTGAGSMEKFDLLVTSDLEIALREAAKFVDLTGRNCAGRLSLALHVAGAERQKTISGDVALTGLALTGFTPGPVNLPEARVTLNATALLDEKNALQSINGLEVDLTAPFASGAISAESITPTPGQSLPALRNAKLILNADLGDVTRFAGSAGLMPAGVELGGQLAFGADLAVDKSVVRMTPNLTLTYFDAAQGGKHLREPKVSLTGSIEVNPASRTAKISDLKLDFTGGSLAVASLDVPDWAKAPAGVTATIASDVEIAEALAPLGDFVALPQGMTVAGQVKLALNAVSDQGLLRLTPSVTLTDLDVTQGAKHLHEPKVALAGSIEADPASRSAKVRDLKCDFSGGSFVVASLDVPDWAKAPAGVTATITSDVDIEQALVPLGDFVALPQGLRVAGQAKLAVDAVAAADKQTVHLDATMTSIKITPATGPAIEEPKFSVIAVADIAPASQTVTFSSLAIKSSFYNLDAKGSLSDWSKAKILTLDGTEEYDLDKIGPLIAAFSGQQVAMSGRSSTPLHIDKLSLGAQGVRALLASAFANATFQIPQVNYMGLNVAKLDVPVQVKDSIATVNVTGQVNNGTLKLPAKVDATQATPEFTLPPNTAILADAQITPAMADQAISKAIPFFKGCTSTQGSISLDSKSLDVPLGADALQKAAFEGSLSFKGVRMSTTGQLQSILAALSLAGAGGADVARIPDQRVTLSLRNGRLYQGPMQITLAGFTMTISGSVGLTDKTLDMAAEIPITPTMVGGRNDIYQALKGEVIRITITGTTDHPEYSIKNSLQKLIQDAGKRLLEQKAREEGGNLINKGLQNLFK
jgi:hypothetical protein